MAAPTAEEVLVLGAGVVGACVAHLLLSSGAVGSVTVVDALPELCQGASKANSGIVHGGYDATPGTRKARFNRRGTELFPDWCRALGVPLKNVGSLVLAFTERDEKELAKLCENARRNGVTVELWDRERVLREEPHVSVGVRQALFCASACIVSPYVFTIACCESAALNGARFILGDGVTAVHRRGRDVLTSEGYEVVLRSGRRLRARRVVNCAGLGALDIAMPPVTSVFKQHGADITPKDVRILPRRGEYVLLSKDQGPMARRVLFQAPTERWGKGVLVSPTVDGNLLLGPSATDQDSITDRRTTIQELAYVAWAARRAVPHLDTREGIRSFAGLRARSTISNDFEFFLDEAGGLMVLAGIDSPGLSSAPALAEFVRDTLFGAALTPTTRREARPRAPYVDAGKPLPPDAAVDHPDPGKCVVCQCEGVLKSTVLDVLQNNPLPPRTPDGVKWRTRCGMGECQGARCRPRVAALLREHRSSSPTAMEVHGSVDLPSPGERVERRMLGKL